MDGTPVDRTHRPGDEEEDVREVDLEALLGGARQMRLAWRGETYTLRVTRNGKVLLNK